MAGSLALAAKFDIKECINPLKNAKKNSLVSVVLVHHNRANLLKEAIKSIEAQTYPNIEVILVDDGSTDADSIAFLDELAWKWWEEKGWKVVREPNRYLGASRNTGVKYATGNFVVFMDDDDFAKPHQIETFVKVALNTKASVITSGHDIFVGNSAPSGKSARRYTPLGAAVLPGMLENIFGDSAMFVERNYFVESGGFTEEQGLGFEDYEFLAKVALNGHHLEAVSEPLHWYRLHQGTMSESTNLKANQLRMLRAYTDRHWTASQRQKDLLEYTQKEFFKAGASPSEYKRDLAFMDRVLNNFVSSFSSLGVNSTHMGANSTHTSLLQSTTSSGIFSSQAPLSSSGISASSSLTTSTVSVSSTRTSSVTPSHTFSPNPCVNVCTVPAIVDMDPSFIPDTFRGVNISVMAYNIETSQLEIEVQSNDLSYKVIPKSAYTIGAKGTNGLTRISLDTKVFLETLRPVSGLPGTFTLILNQGVSFSAFDFTVYVTSSSILNGLAPMNFTVGEPIQVAFSGEHMLATKAPTCLFVDRRNNEYFWTVPSVYDFAASRGICEAPAATQATLFDFYISFNQPKNYLQYALHRYLPAISLSNSNTEVQIAILGAAPVAKSAIFDDSGTFIIVEFDLPIALKSDDDIVYCDDVFNTAPLGITGSSLLAETLEDCFVEIGGVDLLNVYLDGLFVEKFASQVIKPGDNITVKADAIVAGDVPFSQSKSSSTVVAAPASPDAPVIMAVSPSKIGGCSDFSLDVSQSYGSGGRAFTLLTVDVVPRLSGFQAAADGLKVLLNAQAPLILNGSLTEFFISASILKAINGNNGLENAVYDITITMKNAWERTATKTIELTSSVERFVPNAIIYGLGATEVDTRNYNSIAAVVSLPNIQACQDLANITYSFSWTLIGNTSTASDIQSSDSKLDLEPFTLLPNTDYTATVVISPRLLDAPLYSYSYPFRTALDTIITSAGSSRSVGASQYLILDAEIENDAYSVLPIDNFACVWNCTAQDGNSCQYSNGTQIILPSTCKSIDLTGKMSVGIYEFLVNATNSVTGAVTSYQSSTFIEISAGIVPEVSIDASSTNPSSWDESFSLIANVAASSIASVESIDFTWTSEPTCNSKKYSTVDLVYPRTLSVPLISSAENTLKFVPGALSPGASYCFKVSVTDTLNDDKTGYALAIIRVLEAPSGGSCAPSNSYTAANVVELSEFKDDLIFSCKGWTTDKQSFPLLYSFEMKPINSSTWTVLSPISRITDLKLSLSQGSYQIRANVTDSSGSKAVATSRQIFRINVRPLTFVVRRSPQGIYKRQNTRNDAYYTFVSDWLVQKLADFEQTRNSIGLITSISSVAFVGFEMPSIQKHIQLQSQLFTTINKAISDKVVTVDDSGAAFLLSSLQLGVGLSCGLPAANLNQSITLLDKILDTANTTLSTRSSSISSVTANFALLTLNNIMCSTRSTSASVQEKQNSILQKLSGALLRRASCGQTTVSSELSNITSIIGKAASVQYTFNKIRTFGQFSIDASSFNESAIAPDGCPLFQRGTKDSTQYPNGPYLDIDSKVYQMSYLLRSGAPAEVKNAAVNFSIPVDSAFASQFGVATHDLICSFVQYTDATENVKTSTLSTSGCTTVSVIVTGGVTTVNCQCTHLSDFVIGAQLKVVVPSSSSTVAASDNAAAPIATSTSVTTAVPTNVASSVRASATSRTTSSAIAGLAPATSTATAEAAGLSTGALAGIIVGSVIGAAALIALGLYVGYRVIPNKRNIYAPSSGPGDAESQQPEEPRKNKSNRHIVIDETPQIAPDAKSNKKRGSLDKDANSTNGMDEKGKSPNRNAPGYGDFS